MTSATAYPHIVLDATGQARIHGTRLAVKHLVTERLANGWSPEEMAYQHPGLTLGQTYSALAYYEENRAAIDAEIELDAASSARGCEDQAETDLVRRLRALRHA